MGRSHKLVVLVSALALVLVALWLRDSERGGRVVEPRRVEREVVEDSPPPSLVESALPERVALSAQNETAEVSAVTAPVPNVVAAPPAPRLEIEVVEANLEPVAGVSVTLEQGLQRHPRTSDARGRVVFNGADLSGADSLHPVRVCAGVVAREAAWVTVDRPTPPGEPLRLVLPPHGALDVQVLTPEGKPVRGASVELCIVGEPRVGRLTPSKQPGFSARVEMGHARFPCVDLDLQLEVLVESPFGLGRAQALVDGPTFPGELVEHSLALGLDRTILLFRALDDGRRALAGELQLSVEVRYGTGFNSRGVSVEADADGRFEWAVDVACAPGERRELEVNADARGLSARVDLSRSFPPGRIDMGDLVLQPLPLVASGRVVDPEGRPIEGVTVRGSTRINAPKAERPVFMPSWKLSAETAADGAFALHGSVAHGPVQLGLSETKLRAEPLEVILGATDVELVAFQTGGIAGRLLLDPGIRLIHPLSVSVHPDSHPEAVESTSRGLGRRAQKAPGSFALQGLLPGSYTLVVAADEPLFEAHGILVVSGEVANDPRIQEIDLRGRLHLFALALVAPSSSAGLAGVVMFMPAGASAPVYSRHLQGMDSVVELLSTLPQIDATVRVDGYRLEHLTDLGPRTEVHLRTGLCMRLTLPTEFEPPDPPLLLGATLVDAADERAGATIQFFDERGELACFVPAAGRYKVRWLLERLDTGGGSSGSIEIEPPQFVDVHEQEGEQSVALQIRPEALARALEAR
ncbi:MAG: hypothetical protein EXS08_05090 [Planctomycetes bacterium]|nr:hypothetical protein [Planctomycetota bacterium]